MSKQDPLKNKLMLNKPKSKKHKAIIVKYMEKIAIESQKPIQVLKGKNRELRMEIRKRNRQHDTWK